MDADGVLVVDSASVDDGPRPIQDEDLGRPLGPKAVCQVVADILENREWQAMLLGEPADRDRPILLVGVDAEEGDTSLAEIAGELGEPRGICLGEGTLGPEEGQDDDLPVAGLVERVPGSPVVLESEADRWLCRFARRDQADQRHDPDQPGNAHRPALNIQNPLPEPRIDNTTSVREVPRMGPAQALPTPVEWPGKAVGDHGQIGPERVRAAAEAPTKDAKWITNVTRPTISVFRPDAGNGAGVAIVICPGGGYWNLAWDKEGEEVAAWLNTLGITGVVLKYRVPRRPGEPEPLPAPGPLLDAQRAISLVRSRAGEWGIDPERIGIMGFSAGGHLAVMTAISFEKRSYEPIDEVDRASCRPDFAVVAYPGYILTRPGSDVLAEYIRIPKGTGPMFLVHASDDDERGRSRNRAWRCIGR